MLDMASSARHVIAHVTCDDAPAPIPEALPVDLLVSVKPPSLQTCPHRTRSLGRETSRSRLVTPFFLRPRTAPVERRRGASDLASYVASVGSSIYYNEGPPVPRVPKHADCRAECGGHCSCAEEERRSEMTSWIAAVRDWCKGVRIGGQNHRPIMWNYMQDADRGLQGVRRLLVALQS